jgi:zinc protease
MSMPSVRLIGVLLLLCTTIAFAQKPVKKSTKKTTKKPAAAPVAKPAATPVPKKIDLDLKEVVTPDPSITMGVLPNGLKYYIKHNDRPKDRAELILAVNAGAVQEDADQNGLAHFCEHMAFNGTRTFPKQKLVDFLESTGIRFGADLNAYTNTDETVYMLTIPLDAKGGIGKGFEVLRDWARLVSYEDAEIEKERGVILEEWRLSKGADDRLRAIHNKVVQAGSKYADHDVIGDTNILRNAPPDLLRRYYNTWYRPENMAVIVVGDVEAANILPYIQKHFSFSMNDAGGAARRVEYPIPSHKETKISIASDKELAAPEVAIWVKSPALRMRTVGDNRRTTINNLADAMLNARLAEIARKPRPPFSYSITGEFNLTRTTSAWYGSARSSEKNPMRALDVLMTEVERVRKHGFTPTELERAKSDYLAMYERMYNERDKTESQRLAFEYVRNFLVEESIPGIEREFELVKKIMPTIDAADVSNAIASRITDSNRVITISVPEQEGYKKPTESDVNNLLAAIAMKKIDPYVDQVAAAPLIETAPKPGSITSRKDLPEIGAQQWTLSNGATVYVKKSDFKNDQILFRAWSEGGTSLIPTSDIKIASMAAGMVDESGIDTLDATKLGKMLQGKNLSISPSISDEIEGFNGQATPKDLTTMFELLHLYFTKPRMDSLAVSSMKDKLKAELANKSNNPEAVLFDSVMFVMQGRAERARSLEASDVDLLSPSKAFSIYKDRFADPNNFSFAFVGAVDVEKLESLVCTYIASIPGAQRSEAWKDNGLRMPKGKQDVIVRKGVEPKSIVARVYNGTMNYTMEERFQLSALSEVLGIRLREQMREEKQGVYFVSVQAQPDRLPEPSYAFFMYFGCDPTRVDEMLSVIDKELDWMQNNVVDSSYVNKVREIMTKERAVNKMKNEFWMGVISQFARDNEPWSNVDKREELVKALTAEQVHATAKKYLSTPNITTFVLRPEK